MNFDYVYSDPTVLGRMERFKVLKWVKKEAFLQADSGKVKRITPSEFHLYVKSPREAFIRALSRAERQLAYTRERIPKLVAEVASLRAKVKAFEIRHEGKAKA